MSVDLTEYAGVLARAVTPMGSEVSPPISNAIWGELLIDAFWRARLDGFLTDFTMDDDGSIAPISGTDDISRQWISLVVTYAAIGIISSRILATNTSFRAKAGPAEFEVQNSATVLAEMLKQLRAEKDRLMEDILSGRGATSVLLIDAYSVRESRLGGAC